MPVPILSEAVACSGTWQPLRGSLQLSMPVVLIFLCPCFLLRHSLARFGSFTRFELGGGGGLEDTGAESPPGPPKSEGYRATNKSTWPIPFGLYFHPTSIARRVLLPTVHRARQWAPGRPM